MAARSWTLPRTLELSTLTGAALLSLFKYPFTPTAIVICATLLTALLKHPTQIADTRVRRCEDGIGLACGACLPLTLLHSLPLSGIFAALAVSVTVITTAWLKRRSAVLSLCFYAFICSTQSIQDSATESHVFLGAAVPFITDAQLRAYPQTFTVCESAIIAGGIAGVMAAAGERIAKPEATIDAVTNAALIGAFLLWLGVADYKRAPKARVLRRLLVVLVCIGITYKYAWRLMGTEPVLWIVRYIIADVKRWSVFLGWIIVLGFAVIVLRPEQRVERVVARKYYHVLGMIIFGTGIACDEGLTGLGSAVGLCLMVLAEMGRLAGTPRIRKTVNEFAGRLVDERDAGAVVVTHIYLLLGCAGPLWIGGSDAFTRGGVVVVCCMDAIAAAVGRRWGRIPWPGTTRTVEGSLAGFFGAVMLAKAWGGGNEVIAGALVSALLEAVTGQIDNLVLPLAYCSIVGMLQ